MGKKSRRKGKGRNGKGSPSSAPPGASCWICLDEGPDESGQPLVRDCSCRGNSAGFAHVSCLSKYAEQKCASVGSERTVDPCFVEPFIICPNCNQKYRMEVAIAMSCSCVDFVEKTYPDSLWRHLSALHTKLGTIVIFRHYSRDKVVECEEVANKCLAIVKEMKGNPQMKSLLTHVRTMQADVYMLLGNLHLDGDTAISGKKAVEYYEKSKEMRETFHLDVAFSIDARIAEAKALYNVKADSEKSKEEEAEMLLRNYQAMLKDYADDSQEALGHGLALAVALNEAHRGIEAERLLKKLMSTSTRVHGPGHKLTTGIEPSFQAIQVRRVIIPYRTGVEPFQVLRYEDSGNKCVVQGPIKYPRRTDKEVTFSVPTPVIPALGTPVICHGLKSATILNGKLGEMRGSDKNTSRCVVHFEGISGPKLVKLENLRIAFELPETDSET